jgi:hypothetical protein
MRKQLPLIQDMSVIREATAVTNTSDVPALIKNGFYDIHKDAVDGSQKVFLVKRPCFTTQTLVNPSPAPGGTNPTLVAMALSPDGNTSLFTIYSDGTLAGTTLYYNNGVSAKPGTMVGNSGPAYDLITLAANSGLYGNNYWAFTNFLEGFVVNGSGAVTEITDADYTAWTTKSNMVAMDGYIFQADYTSNYIYNSDLNAPTSWTATGRIEANLSGGRIVRLMRIRQYLVVFKQGSIEFFENQGNPTPGSPLGSIKTLARRYGAANHFLFTEASDGIIWVGFDPSGNPGVFKLDTNSFQITKISNTFVDMLLAGAENQTSGPFNLATPYSFREGMGVIGFRDKELVGIPFSALGYSLVYDNKIGAWSMWSCAAGGGADTYVPFFPALRYAKKMLVAGFASTLAPNAYELSETVFVDSFGGQVPVKWASDKLDFGTQRRKFHNTFEILYDQGAYSGGNAGTLSFYYYDTDDATSPASTRSVTLVSSGIGSARAIFRRLGSFRSRKFVITYTGTAPIRIGAVELDISMAQDDID